MPRPCVQDEDNKSFCLSLFLKMSSSFCLNKCEEDPPRDGPGDVGRGGGASQGAN